jgi:hypothetical protein
MLLHSTVQCSEHGCIGTHCFRFQPFIRFNDRIGTNENCLADLLAAHENSSAKKIIKLPFSSIA